MDAAVFSERSHSRRTTKFGDELESPQTERQQESGESAEKDSPVSSKEFCPSLFESTSCFTSGEGMHALMPLVLGLVGRCLEHRNEHLSGEDGNYVNLPRTYRHPDSSLVEISGRSKAAIPLLETMTTRISRKFVEFSGRISRGN